MLRISRSSKERDARATDRYPMASSGCRFPCEPLATPAAMIRQAPRSSGSERTWYVTLISTNRHSRSGCSLRSSSTASRPVKRSGTAKSSVKATAPFNELSPRPLTLDLVALATRAAASIALGFSKATLSRSIGSSEGRNLRTDQSISPRAMSESSLRRQMRQEGAVDPSGEQDRQASGSVADCQHIWAAFHQSHCSPWRSRRRNIVYPLLDTSPEAAHKAFLGGGRWMRSLRGRQ